MEDGYLFLIGPIVKTSELSRASGIPQHEISRWKRVGYISSPKHGYVVLSEALEFIERINWRKLELRMERLRLDGIRSRDADWYDTQSEKKIMSKVTVNEKTGCWISSLCINSKGYSQWPSSLRGNIRESYSHRFMYRRHKGLIPSGLNIDHLCRNRACCNPDHLEAVTPGENTMRGLGPCAINSKKTHCPKGHPLSGHNLRISKCRGRADYRQCKACDAERDRVSYLRKK